jgi:hypothetical protein
MDGERLFTTRESAELINQQLGIPITRSRFHKDSMNGIAPRPAAVFGRNYLYQREVVLEYAKSLLKQPTPAEWELLGEAANRVLEKVNSGMG